MPSENKYRFAEKSAQAIIDALKSLHLSFGEELKAKANQTVIDNPKHDPNKLARSLYNASPYHQLPDPLFPTYNANRLGETNYILAEGPQTSMAICRLLDNTVFNNQGFKIQHLLRIGFANHPTKGAFYSSNCVSFLDYAFAGEYKHIENSASYKTKAELIKGQIEMGGINSNKPYLGALAEITLSIQHANTDTVSEALPLQVYHIPLRDNETITEMITTEEDLAWLYQIYKISKEHPLMIHCSSGVGRAGHVALIFLILDHFDEIMVEDDPIATAKNIADILNNKIRPYRPAAVNTEEQLFEAFKLALGLTKYELTLQEKPIVANQQDNKRKMNKEETLEIAVQEKKPRPIKEKESEPHPASDPSYKHNYSLRGRKKSTKPNYASLTHPNSLKFN